MRLVLRDQISSRERMRSRGDERGGGVGIRAIKRFFLGGEESPNFFFFFLFASLSLVFVRFVRVSDKKEQERREEDAFLMRSKGSGGARF